MSALRAQYEAEVRALAERARDLRAQGLGAEQIARLVHAERRALAARFKALTPEPMRGRITARSLRVHGDADGPSIEALCDSGKSWDQIIEAAARPGRFPPQG